MHHRVLVGAPAWLMVGDERYRAECVDVSMGGAALFTEQPVAAGATARLELSLGSDRGTVSIRCEVVRAEQTELGLRFLTLDRAALEAILSLL
jgi:c-di-GMP-binding flagellar brake protein YcgR